MSDYKDFRENILYRISMKVLEWIAISLFIVLTSVLSLGILTYTSISSSYYYFYKKYREGETTPFRYLLKGIKLNYKQTIPLWFIQAVLLYMGYINYANAGLLGSSPLLYYGVYGCIIILSLVLFYTLQLTTYFDVKITKSLNLSIYFMFMYLFSTATVIVLFVALIFSIYLYPPVVIGVIGLFVDLSSKIFNQIFKKHAPEEVNDNEE